MTCRYAFIGETMTLKHAVTSARDCDLMDVGIAFGMRSYGLAVKRNSALKQALDPAVLALIESGDVEALEEKSVKLRQKQNKNKLTSAVNFFLPELVLWDYVMAQPPNAFLALL